MSQSLTDSLLIYTASFVSPLSFFLSQGEQSGFDDGFWRRWPDLDWCVLSKSGFRPRLMRFPRRPFVSRFSLLLCSRPSYHFLDKKMKQLKWISLLFSFCFHFRTISVTFDTFGHLRRIHVTSGGFAHPFNLRPGCLIIFPRWLGSGNYQTLILRSFR